MGTNAVVGQMQIILSADAATFSAGIDKAQKQLDQLSGKAAKSGRDFNKWGKDVKESGHVAVTGVQAASGALRELEGNFTNNIRAVERFLTTIPGVASALKVAFPLVGGLAFGAMLYEMSEK